MSFSPTIFCTFLDAEVIMVSNIKILFTILAGNHLYLLLNFIQLDWLLLKCNTYINYNEFNTCMLNNSCLFMLFQMLRISLFFFNKS